MSERCFMLALTGRDEYHREVQGNHLLRINGYLTEDALEKAKRLWCDMQRDPIGHSPIINPDRIMIVSVIPLEE